MGQWFFPIFDRAEFWLRRQARSLRFFQFFTRWIFWLRELQLWFALIPMQVWYPRQPAGGGFFPFLIGPNFGSDDRRGPYVFFSFSPGGVVVGFDSDAVLVLTAARGRSFFPFFDRVEFWLQQQPRTCCFFQFFTR